MDNRTMRLDWLVDDEATHGIDFYVTDDDLLMSNEQIIQRIIAPAVKVSLDHERKRRAGPSV